MCQAPPKATPPMTTKAPPTKPHLTLKIPPLTSPTHGHTPNAIYMASPPVTPFTPKTPYSAGMTRTHKHINSYNTHTCSTDFVYVGLCVCVCVTRYHAKPTRTKTEQGGS